MLAPGSDVRALAVPIFLWSGAEFDGANSPYNGRDLVLIEDCNNNGMYIEMFPWTSCRKNIY
jgi:hypothetical protein